MDSISKRYWLGLGTWWMVNLALFAQEPRSAYGYEFRSRRVEIPFSLQCNLIVVRLRINYSDTLNFILDSGVGMNLVTDPKVARSLGLKYIKKIDIVGAGGGQPLEAMVAIGNQIYLSGVKAVGQSLVTLSEDVLALSDYVGLPIHGVFGYDLFRSFVVEIDFHRKVIVLHHPKHFRYHSRQGQKLSLRIEDGKPYVNGDVYLPSGKILKVSLILDTGAGHALSLERQNHPEIALPEKTLFAQLGRGLSGVIHGHLGRVPQLCLGNFELRDIITSFPDTTSKAAELTKSLGRQGNLGCEVLKRFHVIFNYNEGYVVLRPNKKWYKEPFERDMTGMVLKAKGEDYHQFVVEYVEFNSPAYMAGIQAGDEIVSINEKLAGQITLNDVYKLLQHRQGKLVHLFIKRKQQYIYTELVLRKFI
jgi:hypothetical protein